MKGLISACLFGIALAGCAFGDRHAELDYPPSEESGLVNSAQANPASESRGVVYLEDFRDMRLEKSSVGHISNLLGMRTAEVIAARDVSEWVRDAVAYELNVAGYRVEEDAAAPLDATILSGEILYVYCDALANYRGHVVLQVYARRRGRYLLDQKYRGFGSAGTNWAGTGDSYSQSLSLALRESLQKVLYDLNNVGI